MNVVDQSSPGGVRISSLGIGECFKYLGACYMVEEPIKGVPSIVAIRPNGYRSYFEAETRVEPVEAEWVVR